MGGAQPLAGTHGEGRDPVRRDGRGAHRQASCADRLSRYSGRDRSTTALDDPRVRKAKREPCRSGSVGNACRSVSARSSKRGVVPDVVTDQTSAHDLVYGYIPSGRSLDRGQGDAQGRSAAPDGGIRPARSCVTSARCWVSEGRLGRLRQRQSDPHPGEERRRRRALLEIPIFTEAFLRPLFSRAIGPFRWIALSNDIRRHRERSDDLIARSASPTTRS